MCAATAAPSAIAPSVRSNANNNALTQEPATVYLSRACASGSSGACHDSRRVPSRRPMTRCMPAQPILFLEKKYLFFCEGSAVNRDRREGNCRSGIDELI